jgi:hypothetical protein
MKKPVDPGELELVIKAIICRLNGCFEWDPDAADVVRNNHFLKGLTPEGIQEDTIDFVSGGEGRVEQRKEDRIPWRDKREFFYASIIPYHDLFKYGLFVEMELFDRDEEYPVVHLVNAHEEKKR